MELQPQADEIDRILFRAIEQRFVSGAVVYIGCGDAALLHRAYGNSSFSRSARPVNRETQFDLASLTKPIACAASVMILLDRGRLSLADPVARFLPLFAGQWKDVVTVGQLLLHTSGLPAVNPMSDYRDGKLRALARIFRTELLCEPGSRYLYSDVGYIVVGELIAAIDGRGLAEFAADEIFIPLEMTATTFGRAPAARDNFAATSSGTGAEASVQVHDPRAHALGSIAGHAGLFSSAGDVATFCRAILNGGLHGDYRLFSDGALGDILNPRKLPEKAGLRTYMFDVATTHSTAWEGSFTGTLTMGHTGFTGTMLCINPSSGTFAVLLTNAVHSGCNDAIGSIRRDFVRQLGL